MRVYVDKGTAGDCLGVEFAVGVALVRFEDTAVFSAGTAAVNVEEPFDVPGARAAAFSLAILSRSSFLASVSALVYRLRGAAVLGFLI